jgi:hypothetical protein
MKVLLPVAAAVLGFATAVATVLLHDIGWMLLLAWAATLASLWALRPGWQRLAYAVGWIAAATVAGISRHGGYLVGADTRGYFVLVLALLLIVLSIATLPLKGRRRLAGDDEPAGDAYDLAR